jgi:hypothetical protein
MTDGNPVDAEVAKLVSRVVEVLRRINLGSLEAIADTSKRGDLAYERDRLWFEAKMIGKRLMELGGLQLMQSGVREVRRHSALMCDSLEESWESAVPGYRKIRWLP